MEAVLDRFGRIVIPKPIRDHLDMQAGAALQIKADEHGNGLSGLKQGKSIFS